MPLTKISSDKDVWEYDASEAEGIDQLEGEVYTVTFENEADGDKSSRKMFAEQNTCTVTAAKGFTGTDSVQIEDEAGNIATDEVTFS